MLRTISFLLVLISATSFAQIPVDFSSYDKRSGTTAEVKNQALHIDWPTGQDEQGSVVINLDKERPLFQAMRLTRRGVAREVATNLDPAIPADLSQPRLGKRVFDLMDDFANWGHKKYVIAEADLFKLEPDYEIYGHLNVNYLQLDELPNFEEGWQPVLDAMENGKFFATTGEVLLPTFMVNGKRSGEVLKLTGRGNAEVKLEIDWTFPLNFIEIISGDGREVYRQHIPLENTEAFGKKTFTFTADLKGRKWVRVEVWDVAANGAFTQFVWLQ